MRKNKIPLAKVQEAFNAAKCEKKHAEKLGKKVMYESV